MNSKNTNKIELKLFKGDKSLLMAMIRRYNTK